MDGSKANVDSRIKNLLNQKRISRDENKLRSVSFCSRDQSAISGIQFEIIQKREFGCGCINSVLERGLSGE